MMSKEILCVKKINDKLIAKYINNECSEKESSIIENWLKLDTDNKDKIEMAKKVFEREERDQFDPDAIKALKHVLNRLPEQKEAYSVRNWKWLRIAVVLLLIIGATYITTHYSRHRKVEMIVWHQNALENAKIQLPDGSIIWIRQGGEITYPSKFRGKERKIRFSGEAYFEIMSHPKNPFIIQAEGTITRVLGTKFNLNTSSDDSLIFLVLEEGAVEFAYAGSGKNEFTKVEPGQKLRFNKSDHKIYIEENKDLNYLSWKTKSYIYHDRPMNEIISDIECFYDINFNDLPETFSDEYFSFKFDSMNTLEQVLGNLEIITEAKIEKTGNNYYFKPNS